MSTEDPFSVADPGGEREPVRSLVTACIHDVIQGAGAVVAAEARLASNMLQLVRACGDAGVHPDEAVWKDTDLRPHCARAIERLVANGKAVVTADGRVVAVR